MRKFMFGFICLVTGAVVGAIAANVCGCCNASDEDDYDDCDYDCDNCSCDCDADAAEQCLEDSLNEDDAAEQDFEEDSDAGCDESV